MFKTPWIQVFNKPQSPVSLSIPLRISVKDRGCVPDANLRRLFVVEQPLELMNLSLDT
jgi:hypothetical protein